MPISKADMLKGKTAESLSVRTLAFLRGNPGNAYTAEEIALGVGEVAPTGGNDLKELLQAMKVMMFKEKTLDPMVTTGILAANRVESKTGHSEIYYSVQ